MELFKRNPFVRTETQETTLETVTSFAPVEAVDSEQQPRNWPMLAALAIAAFAFIVLIIVSTTWVYHKVHNQSTGSNSAQTLPKQPPQDLAPQNP